MTSNYKETSSLILKTADIYNGNLTNQAINVDLINNDIGQITKDGARITWKNINPKVLLGDMYEKFTKFNLHLCSYSMRKLNADLTDNVLLFSMSGLPWSNQGYNLQSKSITNQTLIFSTSLNATSTNGDGFLGSDSTLTFNRPTTNFDITIDIRNSLNAYPNDYLNHQTFSFSITGVDGYQQNPITNNQELPRNNIDNRLGQLSFR
jgi:hypothetical protein